MSDEEEVELRVPANSEATTKEEVVELRVWVELRVPASLEATTEEVRDLEARATADLKVVTEERRAD